MRLRYWALGGLLGLSACGIELNENECNTDGDCARLKPGTICSAEKWCVLPSAPIIEIDATRPRPDQGAGGAGGAVADVGAGGAGGAVADVGAVVFDGAIADVGAGGAIADVGAGGAIADVGIVDAEAVVDAAAPEVDAALEIDAAPEVDAAP